MAAVAAPAARVEGSTASRITQRLDPARQVEGRSPLPAADRLILDAAMDLRRLNDTELGLVAQHVAGAGFSPAPNTRAGGRLAGVDWQGRILQASDRITPAAAHYLRHAVVQQEWPAGTTLDGYLSSLREVALGTTSGMLVSRFQQRAWQLMVVRRTGTLQGPGGFDWVMIEYQLDLGYWTTGFQLPGGLAQVTGDPRRGGLRWLRWPT